MSGRAQALGVTVVVLLATLVWGVLALQLDVPTVFGDELIYWDASRSLADGDGMAVRGGSYGFGPVYPVLLAPVHALAGGDLDAYRWARLVNALCFALAAVPVLLLARRVVPARWALACAALAVAVPSALYTGFVMTEALAYPVACLAFLAIAAMAERPTTTRQLLALAAVALATGVRLQLAALGAVLLLTLVGARLLTEGARRPARDELTRLWPVGVATALALAAITWRVAGGSPLAGYGGLWQGYDPVEVARWTWRALGGFSLYLAIVPVVAAPAALALLWREGRRGGRAAAAMLALAGTTTVALLLVVGAFSSTTYGVGFLHDRYLFYATPLWVIVLAAWAERREPLRRLELAAGGVVALALLGTLPTYLLKQDGGRLFDAVATAIPGELAVRLGRGEPARWMLLAAVVAAVALVALVPRSRRAALLAVLGAVFLVNGALAWDTRIASARNTSFARLDAASVEWVDRAVPPGSGAVMLAGSVDVAERDALRLTEFFNGSVGRVLELGEGLAPTLSSDAVRLEEDGRVTGSPYVPGEGAHVVTPPTLALAGSVVAEGTTSRLWLWRIESPLRVSRSPG